MNAAAKMMHQPSFFNGQFAEIRMSKPMLLQCSLLLALLLTALAVVYSSNMQRMAYSEWQRTLQYNQDLQLQWDQLLLEKASLATPARVQALAAEKLNMKVPTDKQITLLRLS